MAPSRNRGPTCQSRIDSLALGGGSCRHANFNNASPLGSKKNDVGTLKLNHRTFLEHQYRTIYVGGAHSSGTVYVPVRPNVEHFVAFRIKGKKLIKTELDYDNQQFSKYATPWEKRFSPLVGKKLSRVGKPFTPLVDQHGSVVGYYAFQVIGNKIHRNKKDGKEYYCGTRKVQDGYERVVETAQSGSEGKYLILVSPTGAIIFRKSNVSASAVKTWFTTLGEDIAITMITLGGSLLVKSIVSISKTAASAGARALVGAIKLVRSGGLSKLIVTMAGKFGQANGAAIRLFHNTSKEAVKLIRSQGAKFRSDGAVDDFSKAFYMSDKAVPGMRSIKIDINPKDLGKIVDIRPGGVHRKLFDAFLKEKMTVNGVPLRSGMTYGDAIAHNMNRGTLFEKFLARHGLKDADAIVGPLGDKFTSGKAAISGLTHQIAIRSTTLLMKINKQIVKELAK